ncbi:MAG: c-type cytochrome [Bryobacteraceae bacterium]
MTRSAPVAIIVLSTLLLHGCWSDIPTVQAGRELYRASGCASCHGSRGHGDGPAAKTLLTPPTDFREASHFQWGADEAAIARTILQGVAKVPRGSLTPKQFGAAISNGFTPEQITNANEDSSSSHHQLAMPKFEHLTETERRSIALYVIALRATKNSGGNEP